ncbi:MAG: DUF6384 family protein [Pseudomonas qingdaonensis]|jgi:hypothetical protein|uniref:DUF6384 family protein n=1 Tax=Pseudomonas TaxID=286 RepID=UPI000695FDDF|nr:MULTISPECIES: DUF6384 family protein [unclassified Pseudomonas]MCQ0166395.1 hypothetical protein [Pseudomonas sp. S12(2018)]OOW04925.1 hypothetical protein MF6396_07465 [Pseudomonas sp. MF6396]
MSSVPLSEQLGAMAVVDQLRHQQMQVQEHLNLPQRRAEVAERIRTYYQAQGIAYDDALIEQGVRAFFARRLAFEAPEQTALQRLTTRLLLNRRKLMRILQLIVVALLAVQCTRVVNDTAKTSKVQDNVRTAEYRSSDLSADLAQHQSRLDALQQAVAQQPEPAATRLLGPLAERLTQVQTLLTHRPWPQLIDSDNRDSVQQDLDTYERNTQSARAQLRQADKGLNDVQAIIDARSRLQAVLHNPAFTAGAKRFGVMAQQARVADQAIGNADTQGIEVVDREVGELESQLDRIQQVQPLIRRLDEIEQQLPALRLPPNDLRVVRAQAAQVDKAIDALQARQASDHLSTLDSLLVFARQALELRVVDRYGVKSGVERCYDQALCNQGGDSLQGKSWYLVVEAVDAAGNPISVPVTSSETGESRWASYFGVRVSQAEYLKVKEDKLSDGHIDDLAMGSKPANMLSLKFNQRVAKPDMILDW